MDKIELRKFNEELNKIINESSYEKYDLGEVSDGNAFNVMGYVTRAMKEQDFSQTEIDEYRQKATSGNFDNLLRVSMIYIDKCNERASEKEEPFKQNTNQKEGSREGSFSVHFEPGKYFLGDVCYALPEDIYDEVWGDKYNYQNGYFAWDDEDGNQGEFAVASTAYGDGEYYGGIDVFLVDAGVLGVTDITDRQRYTDSELSRIGKVVRVSKGLDFSYDKDTHSFTYNVDGKEFTVETEFEDDEDFDESRKSLRKRLESKSSDLQRALADFLNVDISDLKPLYNSDCCFEVKQDGETAEYEIYDDREDALYNAKVLMEDKISSQEEIFTDAVRWEQLGGKDKYFKKGILDVKKLANDLVENDLGWCYSSYDGEEYTHDFNGKTYTIFRQG